MPGYGTGSMSEVAGGRWRLRVYLGPSPGTGRPRQRERTFRGTEGAARRELARMLADARSERGQVMRRTTSVGRALDEWLAFIEPRRSGSTVYGYRRQIERTLKPALGDRPLASLTPDDLDRFYRSCLDRGQSPSTVHHYHATLSAALQHAERSGWIAHNPTRLASPPRAADYERQVPTPEQVGSLVAACHQRDSALATAIALAALTGARRGELCALRWSDLDARAGTLSVTRSVNVRAGRLHEGPMKSHQVRSVSLDATALDVLADRRVRQQALSDLAACPLVDDPYVLSVTSDGGRPIGPDTITHRFSALARKLGWPFRFRDLRHFSVSTLLRAGVDLDTVVERHGYAQATRSHHRSAHPGPERDRAAAALIGSALALPGRTSQSGDHETGGDGRDDTAGP